MKKIINGKIYDTTTAKLIGRTNNGCGYGDLNWIEENLFRKKTGEFFIFGEGGARTRYASSVGDNSWSSGSAIIPISEERAREWAEHYLDADEYENIFGKISEDETTPNTTVNLPEKIVAKLNQEANLLKMSVHEYLEYILDEESE